MSEELISESTFPELNDLINTSQKSYFEVELQLPAVQRKNEIQEKIIEKLKSQLIKFTYDRRDTIDKLSSLEGAEILERV